jgi:LysR family transcriptional regulator for metE and metH
MKNLTFKQLRALKSVALTGSVTAASEELAVTPHAVTLQIQQLEEQVGLPLLERGRNDFRLTEPGKVIFELVKQLEEQLRQAEESIYNLRGVEGGRIRIGVISTAKYFMPKAIAAFLRDHLEIQLDLKVGNRQEIVSGLRSASFDFAIMGRPPEDLAVISEVIGDHPHVFISSPSHSLSSIKNITLEKLTNETPLLREQGSGTRMLLHRFLTEQKIEWRKGMEMGSNESIKQGVMAGLGISFISAHTIAAEVEEGRLAVLDVVGTPLVRHWYLVRLQEKKLLPASLAFWEFLEKSCRDFLPKL